MKLQVSVSAIIIKNGKFILIKRIQFDEFGKVGSWTLPCGRIKFFENPNKAVTREVKEETNLNVKVLKPLSIWSKRKGDVWRISICYLCKYKGRKLKLSKEHSDSIWLAFKDVKKAKIEKWIKNNAKLAMKK